MEGRWGGGGAGCFISSSGIRADVVNFQSWSCLNGRVERFSGSMSNLDMSSSKRSWFVNFVLVDECPLQSEGFVKTGSFPIEAGTTPFEVREGVSQMKLWSACSQGPKLSSCYDGPKTPAVRQGGQELHPRLAAPH